ncbi:hypothetical protein BDQ17DRAFT_1257064, partial [Cyathus striatus]
RDGTGNLVTGLKQCNERLQKCALAQDIDEDTIPYSEVAFRTLIALHCAASNRPFNIVNDKYYQLQVNMLHPGTKLPSDRTVQRDTLRLFQKISLHVKEYFLVGTFIIEFIYFYI